MTKTEIHLFIRPYHALSRCGQPWILGSGGRAPWTFPYGCSWLAPTLSTYSSVMQPPKVLTLARVSHPEPASGPYSQISNRPRPLPCPTSNLLRVPCLSQAQTPRPQPGIEASSASLTSFYLLQVAILPATALHCLSLEMGTFRHCRIRPSQKKVPEGTRPDRVDHRSGSTLRGRPLPG